MLRVSRLATASAARQGPLRTAVLRASVLPLSSGAGAPSSMVERLEQMATAPWYRSGFMRLVGMFSDKQFQCAAGEDLHRLCVRQAEDSTFYDPVLGGVDRERFFPRFQIKGLHCWLVHVRTREMPRAKCEHLFTELMERFWEYDAMRDIVENEGLELIQALKYQKELQVAWHGMVQSLDIALKVDPPRDALAEVLRRNIYAGPEGELPSDAVPASRWLADYLLAQIAQMRTLPDGEVLRGRVSWAPPPSMRDSGSE